MFSGPAGENGAFDHLINTSLLIINVVNFNTKVGLTVVL